MLHRYINDMLCSTAAFIALALDPFVKIRVNLYNSTYIPYQHMGRAMIEKHLAGQAVKKSDFRRNVSYTY